MRPTVTSGGRHIKTLASHKLRHLIRSVLGIQQTPPNLVLSVIPTFPVIGFLLYLPFIVIDLIISNVLIAMGIRL